MASYFINILKMLIDKIFYSILVNFGLLVHTVTVVATVENNDLGIAGVILLDFIE